MKKSLLISISALLLLFGCDYNDKYFDGLDDLSRPKDVFSKQYTLLEGDYKTIADNKANIAMAEAEGVSTQLKNLATNKYFTGPLDPKKYIPAFLLNKYIAADDGSVVKVTYDYRGDIKDYMPDLNGTTIYKLSADDYKRVWGEDSKLNFFTPSKPAANYLLEILKDNMKNPVEGDIVAASYNVSEKEPADKNAYSTVNTLYTYNGTDWTLYSESNVIMLGQADLVEMGGRYDDFSNSMNPDNYLPAFLKRKYPYALEGDVKIVVYKYFSSSVTSIRADKYQYINGQFVRELAMSQFAYSDGSWKFDPSTVITLSTSKSDLETSLFYQTITDWVYENHREFVTTYGNNDYYYGGSAYNNNFDFRVSAWEPYYGEDVDVEALMFERLPESFPHALKVLYADANTVEGVQVIYTINFFIYNGTTTSPYTIKYLVVGKGEFEYIKDSVKKVE